MNNIQKTHQWILSNLKDNAHVIDMTAGNGHDTKFLAQHAAKVTSIDIQAQAILNTKKRCRDFDNIDYINMDHSLVNYESLEPINGVVYNLGYLPHGDKNIITKKDSTLKSLELIKDLVEDFIVITVYPGHEGGDIEAEAVYKWIVDNKYAYISYSYETKSSPIAYCIKF